MQPTRLIATAVVTGAALGLQGAFVIGFAASPASAASPSVCTVAADHGRADNYPAVAAFRSGTWYVRGSLTSGSADLCFVFGQAGDQPVVGDWNGDGLPTPGVFRPSTGTWYLSNAVFAQSGADIVVRYGSPGDVAYPGDWNSDHVDSIGVYRPSNRTFYLRNENSSGMADGAVAFGNSGDQPAPGRSRTGEELVVFRSSTAAWYVRGLDGTAQKLTTFGAPGDVQLAGPWAGGATGLGAFLASSVGVYRSATNTIYTDNGQGYSDNRVVSFVFGDPGDVKLGLPPRCTVTYCGYR